MLKKEYNIHYDNLNKLDLRGIYLIRNLDNNLLKIGKCNNLSDRFKQIQKTFRFCGILPNLKIECFIEFDEIDFLESYLHYILKDFNFISEWFYIDDITIVLNKIKECEIIHNKYYTYSISYNKIKYDIFLKSKSKDELYEYVSRIFENYYITTEDFERSIYINKTLKESKNFSKIFEIEKQKLKSAVYLNNEIVGNFETYFIEEFNKIK